MEVVLLLYLREEAYGRRLLRYLIAKKNSLLHPELVTHEEMIANRVGTERQRVVVLTDREEVVSDDKKEFIYLSNRRNHAQNTIFQYQKAEKVYEELLVRLGIQRDEPAALESVVGKTKKGILFFVSPDAIGMTAVATMAAQYLGEHGSCLYVNLTGFPVWFEGELNETPDFQLPGVGELLFMSERRAFIKREREIRKVMGKAYLLPPFHHYKDLLDSTKEDWQKLFQRLQTDCGYDCVVVELGPLMEHTLDLLELGDEIMFFSQKGILGQIRLNVWKQYCRIEKMEELLQQIRWLLLPEEWQEWETMIIEQSWEDLSENKQLMSRIEELLYEDGEEGDNVYCLEGFG